MFCYSFVTCDNSLLRPPPLFFCSFFFFTDTAPTEIYTLSLHDALPILHHGTGDGPAPSDFGRLGRGLIGERVRDRSEEHTSELQSLTNLVCRLLLEKKKKKQKNTLFYQKSSKHRTMN